MDLSDVVADASEDTEEALPPESKPLEDVKIFFVGESALPPDEIAFWESLPFVRFLF
jgi:hypothetical protein